MKKVLIIGGSGKLSGALAKQLAEAGCETYAMTRGKQPLAEGIHPLVADREDADAVKTVLRQTGVHFDAVFDCICMKAVHAELNLEILPEFTGRLVVVSTDSVFDPKQKKMPQTEEGAFVNPETPDYAGNKRAMELVYMQEMEKKNPCLDITIFRPGHIYGPQFALGCYPEESRKQDLPDFILAGKPMALVAGGIYIIHPIYVDDLTGAMIDCVDKEKTFGQIYCIGGPEAIENKFYYECLAKLLGVELTIQEVALTGYAEAHPEYAGHLNHRIYCLDKLQAAGVSLPATSLMDGLRISLQGQGYTVVC